MSLRRRVTIVIAVAVAVAIAVCAGASWLIVRDQMRDQLIESLEQFLVRDDQVAQALARCGQDDSDQPWDPSGRGWQLVRSDGSICQGGSSSLEPILEERALLLAQRPVGGARRHPARPLPDARHRPDQGVRARDRAHRVPLDPRDGHLLRVLGLVLAGVCAVGVLGAALTGLLAGPYGPAPGRAR